MGELQRKARLEKAVSGGGVREASAGSDICTGSQRRRGHQSHEGWPREGSDREETDGTITQRCDCVWRVGRTDTRQDVEAGTEWGGGVSHVEAAGGRQHESDPRRAARSSLEHCGNRGEALSRGVE